MTTAPHLILRRPTYGASFLRVYSAIRQMNYGRFTAFCRAAQSVVWMFRNDPL